MTTIEYLSLNKGQKIAYKISNFFVNIPKAIGSFFYKLPKRLSGFMKKLCSPFIVLKDALLYGDARVRLSFLFCGFGSITRHQVVRGCAALLYEIVYTIYMILAGGPQLALLASLGTFSSISTGVPNPSGTGYVNVAINYDNSFTILLFAIFTILLSLFMIVVWYSSIKSAKILCDLERIGHHESDKQYMKDFLGKKFHTLLLSVPVVGLILFTIVPVIYMVLVGFTNYNSYHLPNAALFEWVGWQNYQMMFTSSASATGSFIFLQTILLVLAWTLTWAFFATFSNYFIGMVVAVMINRKGIKLKKLWRTILVTTIAVPQFVSLLLVQQMFNENYGIFNSWITSMGGQAVKWLSDGVIAKVVIIVVNTWVGIPYTMLICSGILMNIPTDLYESARIDGASPFKMYMKITLPYMLFITTPYLISQFVGNINNFNIIYLLTSGGPLFQGVGSIQQLNGVGETDLLITWIYKMTVENAYKDYGAASVLGVFVFAVVAFFSLIFYGRSNSVKNEEDFQ